MAKGHNQKLKLLYLAKIFAQETDEDHALSMAQILSALEEYGVHADRKTIYADLEELRTFGMEIIDEPDGRGWHYYLGAREFELPELKLLVDSVQSARFITDRKSKELIGKLEKDTNAPGFWDALYPWHPAVSHLRILFHYASAFPNSACNLPISTFSRSSILAAISAAGGSISYS